MLQHGQLLSRAKPPEGTTGATTLAIAPRCHQLRRLKHFDKASCYGGWVVFGKSSCYWLYLGDVDEILMCQLLRQCARLKVCVFLFYVTMFCLGVFHTSDSFFQVVTCYNQSGSVKKKQTLIHSNQILPSMMRLSGVLLG